MSVLLGISTVTLNDAARGLSQQMVFWGHDVRHVDGNALVRFGLVRSPSPGLTGTSCYSMAWENGTIELHGAVASWTPHPLDQTGFIFARDRGRIECWTSRSAPVPGRDAGESGTSGERWGASLPFLRWLVHYEKWVATTLGESWRTSTWRSLKRLPKGKPWLPPELALKWWGLAAAGEPLRPRELLRS